MSASLSNLPILAPLNAILHDEKVVLVALWLVTTALATAVPAFAPYMSVIVPMITILYTGLIAHQSYEDGLKTYRDNMPTSIPDAINTIEVGIVKDVVGATTTTTTTATPPPPVIVTTPAQ